MKKTSLIDKLLFLLNSLIAVLVLLSFLIPLISPKTAPFIAILSLFVPTLLILNFAFGIYWLLKLKKQFMLSAFVLVLSWFISPPLYKISKKEVLLNNDVSVMSYNVRMFNHYKWSDDKELAQKTFDFITEKSPDILVIQEFYQSPKITFSYPYKYVKTKSKTNKFGLAIFSKYPIANSGSLDFKNSANNIIFADVIKNEDTVRIYNIHLESLKINPNKEHFGEENNEKLLGRLKTTFQKQAEQTQLFLEHEKTWKGKKIICGDFNNTAYSWVYNKISDGKKDAFIEAGTGFGKTFNYPFPLRIDFILTGTSIEINHYKTYRVKLSDHFPVLARLNW